MPTLTKNRYIREWELMYATFPQFTAYARPPIFGWRGYLQSRKTHRRYRVTLESQEALYPSARPWAFIEPRFGGHWLINGALCIETPWDPATHTFANTLLRVIEYMEKYDA